MTISASLNLGRLLFPIILIMALVDTVSAQYTTQSLSEGANTESTQSANTDGTILQIPKAPTSKALNTKPPTSNGRWVPRTDSKTCPNGSTVYIDEKNGGVKCWVNDK